MKQEDKLRAHRDALRPQGLQNSGAEGRSARQRAVDGIWWLVGCAGIYSDSYTSGLGDKADVNTINQIGNMMEKESDGVMRFTF